MDKKLLQDGKNIIKKIEQAGEEAYFVGGCVRDLLLKKPVEDIDIATSATPQKMKQIFSKVIPVGIEHGTVIVRYNNRSYEVTTFRLDGKYSDHRHPDQVEFVRSLDEDLKRRDFTMNAIAMDREGKIIDLFHGQKDLSDKMIRTVGHSYDRFTEDALRMFRAIRFASQLNFKIEPKTFQAIKELRKNIERVAIERLQNEFIRLFKGAYVSKGIYYLERTKIYKNLPILSEEPVLVKKMHSIQRPLQSFAEIVACLNHLYPTISIKRWIKEWKASNRSQKQASVLKRALTRYGKQGLDEWLLYKLPPNLYKAFYRLVEILYPKNALKLQNIEHMANQLPIFSRKELAVNGKDILETFPNFPKGPWIEHMLKTLEKKVVFQKLENNEGQLKEWMKCNPPTINS